MKFIIAAFLTIGLIESPAQIYKTNHFVISYTKLDQKNIKESADSLEANYTRIISDLQCPGPIIVKIHFYTDTLSYREGVKKWVRNLPPWSGGLTLGDSMIHVISPNAPNQDYRVQIKNVIHEFAHCVSRHINKTIANNPRWLWESIAIYESGQKSDPRDISYLVDQKPPSLNRLNDWSDTTVYDVGYFLCEYLVETKGKTVLNSLIKNNGNLKQTLNMDDEEFTKQWFAFVKRKYGI